LEDLTDDGEDEHDLLAVFWGVEGEGRNTLDQRREYLQRSILGAASQAGTP